MIKDVIMREILAKPMTCNLHTLTDARKETLFTVVPICNYMQMENKDLSTAQVAALAGVHRDTLLRWLRDRAVPEPRRDRHGWRTFSAAEASDIAAYARGKNLAEVSVTPGPETEEIKRLKVIDWDFATAKTSYLTHNLHPYPAKFIPQIPNALIQELSSVGETVADIFCGSGTTLLEALQLKRHAIGIDANPLAGLITQAKTATFSEQDFLDIQEHRSMCSCVIDSIEPNVGDLFYGGNPFVSKGWRPEPSVCEFWFTPTVVEELAEIRRLIDSIPDGRAKNLCRIAFSAIVVVVSKQDSDTRYVRREKDVRPGDTLRRYAAQLDASTAAIRELTGLVEDRFRCKVICNNVLSAPTTEPIDLVVTSPPYPNAYSYHLYHRTRLIWLGYDPDEFKRIEIGSHRKYSSKGPHRATEDTFKSEFETIFRWLRTRLRDRRYACFVIGNSTLAGSTIDNADILAAAGAVAGFREVARLNRTILATRKAFNPANGKIKNENVLILQKV
jgi:site-specific DNA-methyltransferase (cytosine-N4-specific)